MPISQFIDERKDLNAARSSLSGVDIGAPEVEGDELPARIGSNVAFTSVLLNFCHGPSKSDPAEQLAVALRRYLSQFAC